MQSRMLDLLWTNSQETPNPTQLNYWPFPSQARLDYTRLRNLLVKGKWEEADAETKELMLKIAGREKEGLLDRKSGQEFPCEELCTIDNLWVRYSQGRFGFSVQKQILENLIQQQNASQQIAGSDPSHQPNQDNSHALRELVSFAGFRDSFGLQVGWQIDGKWLRSHELIFDLSAPSGHLPSPRIATPSDLNGGGEEACQETVGRWCSACCFGSVWCGVLFSGWWSILNRINECPCKITLNN